MRKISVMLIIAMLIAFVPVLNASAATGATLTIEPVTDQQDTYTLMLTMNRDFSAVFSLNLMFPNNLIKFVDQNTYEQLPVNTYIYCISNSFWYNSAPPSIAKASTLGNTLMYVKSGSIDQPIGYDILKLSYMQTTGNSMNFITNGQMDVMKVTFKKIANATLPINISEIFKWSVSGYPDSNELRLSGVSSFRSTTGFVIKNGTTTVDLDNGTDNTFSSGEIAWVNNVSTNTQTPSPSPYPNTPTPSPTGTPTPSPQTTQYPSDSQTPMPTTTSTPTPTAVPTNIPTPTNTPVPTLPIDPAKLKFEYAPIGSAYDYVMTFTMNTDFLNVNGLCLAYPNTKFKAVATDGTLITDTALITVPTNETLANKKFWFNTAKYVDLSGIKSGLLLKNNNIGEIGYDGILLTAYKNVNVYTNTTAPVDLYKIYFKSTSGVLYSNIANDFKFCIPSSYTPDENEVRGISAFPQSSIPTGFSYSIGNGTSYATINANNNINVILNDNTIPPNTPTPSVTPSPPNITIFAPDNIYAPPIWASKAKFHVGSVVLFNGKSMSPSFGLTNQIKDNPYIFKVELSKGATGVNLIDGQWLEVDGTAPSTSIELKTTIWGTYSTKSINVVGQAGAISTGLTVQPPFILKPNAISSSTDALQGVEGNDLIINLNTPGGVNTFYKVFEGSPDNALATGKGEQAIIIKSKLTPGKHMITVWTANESLATKNIPAYGRNFWVYISPLAPLPITSIKLTYNKGTKEVSAQAYNNATALDNAKMLYKYFYKAKSAPATAWVEISNYTLNDITKVVVPPIALNGVDEYIVAAYAKATYSITALDKLGMIIVK